MCRVQLKAVRAAQNVVAQQACCTRFFQRCFEALVSGENFAVNVVVADRDAHGIGCNRHAFDHDMRVVLHDVAVFGGAGLAFVRIADQVLLTRKLTRHEAPLQTGRETSAATTAQTAGFDFSNDLIRRHAFTAILAQNLAQSLVAAAGFVIFQAPITAIQTRHDLRADVTAVKRSLHAGGGKLGENTGSGRHGHWASADVKPSIN